MEGLNPRETIKPIAGGVAIIAASLFLSQFAFTRRVREEIYRRDRYCQGGDTGHNGNLEAAHYDHDRDNPAYNDSSNGRLLCTQHHLEDHIEGAGHNGLPEHQNNWAIKMIKKRLGKEP